ncbi:HaeIII family restriction endonuclease [Acinetobacter johnsonii]|uniref:HaeIII family restriction endonuclease n=1 Tax=Acinetobacter johnsonii TaxID=40214 RepID=A0AA42XEQ2_ACIJO|nr:HaeIII family restriction endonuclease [Acinetobacter johnsonii]MDH1276495.1 HaeIII family restriction endonuclease [Acinetobacter johnsonii]MDH1518308.1 HaeIII family restriction endonuclease [Acinetobacter johnsonii]MDH2172095.1 HaeIII family restriction endonuclease [Acinetobacter johnsonii]MDH2175307.1 HaeIII family restriction endonuclease [Acinetobacter johnsonii]MDQ8974070.1 HaeIII family restriction endonuclease [Acinetobacter johnsonii]
MVKVAKQTINGKAFEYAVLLEFQARLTSLVSVIEIIENEPYNTALNCFNSFIETEQEKFRLIASFAINYLIDIEPRLSNQIDIGDILQLEIVPDKAGESGDVRDVLALRSSQNWEIGISAKNNHRAVKHSRLSNDIDFGQKWLGLSCTNAYFNKIKPIFDNLAQIKKNSKSTQKWETLGDYHSSVYIPVLDAFKEELIRLDKENPGIVAARLVEYLIGNKDFYKVIKGNNKVEIQSYNLHGTLNLPFRSIKPKAKVPKLKLPNRLIEVVYKEDSQTTLLVTLNEGWQISFRIHNASSRIEPSLKFDINLVSAPHSLHVTQLFVS